MSEFSPYKKKSNGESQSQDTSKELEELKHIIIGHEQIQIAEIEERVDEIDEVKLSNVLPKAIVLGSKQDDKLNKALSPVVEDAITLSVKKNPKPLADAIFPVIGPAIRKAISNALSELTQSVNQSLEHSFNLKWRLEALKTGKPFSEIVLSHSLLYRVEQVYLIHEETGIPLQHVVSGQLKTQDSDLVSGMLKAIQDFVKDSFATQEGDELESFKVGDLSIWLEEGPHAIIAAVIRGNAPQEYRNVLKEAVENIHLEFGNELESFIGDSSIFEQSKSYLEACLISKSQEKENKSSLLLPTLLGALLLPFLIWIGFKIHGNMLWSNYIDKIRSEPGIVVTDYGKKSGKFFISGLLDPEATDPNEILNNSKLNPEKVVSNWEPYISFNPELILKRIKSKIEIPKTVNIDFKNTTFFASGKATKPWADNAAKKVLDIPGVNAINFETLDTSNLEEIQRIISKIENTNIFFDSGSYKIKSTQNDKLENLLKDLHTLNSFLVSNDKKIQLEIIGFTDSVGSYSDNSELSLKRAINIKNLIVSKGIKIENLRTTGQPSQNISKSSISNSSAYDRRVSFKVSTRD